MTASEGAAEAVAPEEAPEHLDAATLACLEPIAGTEVGEDPRYEDAFERVQAEINRLAGADFEAVAETSRTILRDQAKDLRVCGYLALARAARGGLADFADGVELMARLVERFAGALHPRRAKARQAALQFIGQERIAGLLEQAADAGDAQARERLQQSLHRLQAAAGEHLEMADVAFGAVSEWIREHPPEAVRKRAVESSDESAADDSGGAAASSPGAGGSAAPQLTRPSDDQELGSSLRRLLAYLREAERWPEHVAFARAYRWSNLAEPPADGGTTRIPAPRQQAIAPIEAACNKARWQEGLAAAERAFLEPGGQFLFRIQRLAAQCARQAEAPHVAERIETEVALLCRRLPGLQGLRFSDDTPFADEADRNWIDSLADSGDGESDARTASLDEQYEHAREVLAEEGLGTAIHALAPHPGAGGRELAQARLRQASLCLEAERADAARPLLEGVLDDLDRGGHAGWDRALTAQVLRVLLRANDHDTTQAREQRTERQALLRERLARLDLSSAVTEIGRPAESTT